MLLLPAKAEAFVLTLASCAWRSYAAGTLCRSLLTSRSCSWRPCTPSGGVRPPETSVLQPRRRPGDRLPDAANIPFRPIMLLFMKQAHSLRRRTYVDTVIRSRIAMQLTSLKSLLAELTRCLCRSSTFPTGGQRRQPSAIPRALCTHATCTHVCWVKVRCDATTRVM